MLGLVVGRWCSGFLLEGVFGGLAGLGWCRFGGWFGLSHDVLFLLFYLQLRGWIDGCDHTTLLDGDELWKN
jgi:hypothetical protein